MADTHSRRKRSKVKGTTRACKVCCGSFEPKHTRQQCCSRECGIEAIRTVPESTCAVCGTRFRPKGRDRVTCCSRACGFEYQRSKREPKAKRSRVWFPECERCGSVFAARRSGRKRCDRCRGVYARTHYMCRQCGANYSYRYTGGCVSGYCSDLCRLEAKRSYRRRYKKQFGKHHRQRARQYGVRYEPVDAHRVFERDGWRCQICGKDTPRERRGSRYPNAPELDHRVPISSGGGHTYSNTQCACRACNGAKGNRSQVGQLPLVAIRNGGG